MLYLDILVVFPQSGDSVEWEKESNEWLNLSPGVVQDHTLDENWTLFSGLNLELWPNVGAKLQYDFYEIKSCNKIPARLSIKQKPNSSIVILFPCGLMILDSKKFTLILNKDDNGLGRRSRLGLS